MTISIDMIDQAARQIRQQLRDYVSEMDIAFTNDDDEKLSVTAKINFKINQKSGKMEAETLVSFVKDRIKDKRPVFPSGEGPLFEGVDNVEIHVGADVN